VAPFYDEYVYIRFYLVLWTVTHSVTQYPITMVNKQNQIGVGELWIITVKHREERTSCDIDSAALSAIMPSSHEVGSVWNDE